MSGQSRVRAVVPWVERILWITALACAVYSAWFVIEAHAYQHRAFAQRASDVLEAEPVEAASVEPVKDGGTAVLGRLDIPGIAMSVPILAGDETESLRHGLFHIKGTAMPGGLGTVGLAGHRDTFFRPLRGIKPTMGIELTDHSGTYHYAIDSTEIVTPDRVEVLDIGERPELTLVTCYPFNFIGAAPKRFIVHAHLLSVSPDEAAGVEAR